jgi:hypothetical protein
LEKSKQPDPPTPINRVSEIINVYDTGYHRGVMDMATIFLVAVGIYLSMKFLEQFYESD